MSKRFLEAARAEFPNLRDASDGEIYASFAAERGMSPREFAIAVGDQDPGGSLETMGRAAAELGNQAALGFGDELAGLAAPIVQPLMAAGDVAATALTGGDIGEAVERGRAALDSSLNNMRLETQNLARAERQRGYEDAPELMGAAGLTGGLATGGATLGAVGAARGAAGLSAMPGLAGQAALGAVEGGIAGAGNADGTLADRARGAAMGAGLGAALPVGISAAGRLPSVRIAGAFVRNPRQAAQQAAEFAETGFETLAGAASGMGGGIGGAFRGGARGYARARARQAGRDSWRANRDTTAYERAQAAQARARRAQEEAQTRRQARDWRGAAKAERDRVRAEREYREAVEDIPQPPPQAANVPPSSGGPGVSNPFPSPGAARGGPPPRPDVIDVAGGPVPPSPMGMPRGLSQPAPGMPMRAPGPAGLIGPGGPGMIPAPMAQLRRLSAGPPPLPTLARSGVASPAAVRPLPRMPGRVVAEPPAPGTVAAPAPGAPALQQGAKVKMRSGSARNREIVGAPELVDGEWTVLTRGRRREQGRLVSFEERVPVRRIRDVPGSPESIPASPESTPNPPPPPPAPTPAARNPLGEQTVPPAGRANPPEAPPRSGAGTTLPPVADKAAWRAAAQAGNAADVQRARRWARKADALEREIKQTEEAVTAARASGDTQTADNLGGNHIPDLRRQLAEAQESAQREFAKASAGPSGESRVLSALQKLAKQKRGGMVTLEKLRAEAGLPREEFDAAMRELRIKERIDLSPNEGTHYKTSAAEREAGIEEAGSRYIWAREMSPSARLEGGRTAVPPEVQAYASTIGKEAATPQRITRTTGSYPSHAEAPGEALLPTSEVSDGFTYAFRELEVMDPSEMGAALKALPEARRTEVLDGIAQRVEPAMPSARRRIRGLLHEYGIKPRAGRDLGSATFADLKGAMGANRIGDGTIVLRKDVAAMMSGTPQQRAAGTHVLIHEELHSTGLKFTADDYLDVPSNVVAEEVATEVVARKMSREASGVNATPWHVSGMDHLDGVPLNSYKNAIDSVLLMLVRTMDGPSRAGALVRNYKGHNILDVSKASRRELSVYGPWLERAAIHYKKKAGDTDLTDAFANSIVETAPFKLTMKDRVDIKERLQTLSIKSDLQEVANAP